MSILDALRAGIKVADTITKPLQTTVILSRVVVSADGYQTRSYPTSVSLPAVVDWQRQIVETSNGVSKIIVPVVQFLDVATLLAATGNVGLSVEDQIMLPDGTSRFITSLSGFLDAGTGKPVATEARF